MLQDSDTQPDATTRRYDGGEFRNDMYHRVQIVEKWMKFNP